MGQERNMNISNILEDLKNERQAVDEAIAVLERIADGRGKRRGRPPTWLVEARKKKPEEVEVADIGKKNKVA